jgi:hypothetical protein
VKLTSLVAIVGLSLLPTCVQAQSGPPALCKPCLFYGGDSNQFNADDEIFSNEDTLSYLSTVYGAIRVPANHSVLIEGILFQAGMTNFPDPQGAYWDIRSGLEHGGAGTSVASGSGAVAIQSTGRYFDQYNEYTVLVNLNPPVELDGGGDRGTEYWFNLNPVCLELMHSECRRNEYWVSNTPNQANAFRPALQEAGEIRINSVQFGYDWESVCTAYDLQANQCAWLSFGLTGKILQ